MTIEEAIKVLHEHQLWRRGSDEYPATDPKKLGQAIDIALEAMHLMHNTQELAKEITFKHGDGIVEYYKSEAIMMDIATYVIAFIERTDKNDRAKCC